MSLSELANSFGAPAFQDTLLYPNIPNSSAESISSSSYCSSFPLDYTFQHLDLSNTVTAFAQSNYSQEEISWGLQQYINSSTVPWTDKILLVSSAQGDSSFEVTQTLEARSQKYPKKEPLSLSIGSRDNSAMSYHRGSATAISYGLPASVDMDYIMVPGARQASGDGRGYHQRSSEGSYTYSKGSGGGGPSRSSKHSKARQKSDRDEGEDDEGTDHPNYIPSSSTRTKSRATSSSDFACWFFKLDPVKYADCMHVHGRSSDLKYAHLKNHFRDGTIPSGFDKNMSWDEVWATLFPRIRPPNNKYYVINDMIMSVLESASIDGDDVTRFLDTIGSHEGREAVLNRIYSLSGDRGNSPGSAATTSTRRNRREHGVDRIPRTVGNGFTGSPPSSAPDSGDNTPAIASRPSHRFTPNFNSYHHTQGGLELGIDDAMGVDAHGYHPFSDAVGTLPPVAAAGEITIWDETISHLMWLGRELPWQSPIDFSTFYLSHTCTKTGGHEVMRIYSFSELQEQYAWHEAGPVDGSCPFTLIAHTRRG
ncbi:hypothetical protein TWF506_005270 [Arthrobotrys conoides]|uniref:Uncharacterized protein n=1 Tax=Arthrobotrys conoides TaxID=74498 RepID=A0AAN8NIY3_9PEZI